MEFPAPVGAPGAIVWKDDVLYVQAFENNRIYKARFNRKKRALIKESVDGPMLCLQNPDKIESWYGGCEFALDAKPGPDSIRFLGVTGIADVKFHGNDEVTNPDASTVPKGTIAVFSDTEHLSYLTEDDNLIVAGLTKPELNSGRFDFHPPSVGLVYANQHYYTITRGTGQILKYRTDSTSGNYSTRYRVVEKTPQITRLPYGLAYDQKNDVFWVSSPLLSKIYRVSSEAFKSIYPQQPISGSPEKNEISNEMVWTKGEKRIGDTVVARGAKLTIESGAMVNISGSLRVEGELLIDGTYENPVVLDAADPDGWWDGILVLPGGRVKISGAVITRAKHGIEAEDPNSLVIENNSIKNIFGDGIHLKLSAAKPSSILIANNEFKGAGGTGIRIVLEHGTIAPAGAEILIKSNLFAESGSGLDIGPQRTRHIEERIAEMKSPPPFKTTEKLRLRIENNIFSRNIDFGAQVSGDTLDYGVEVEFTENAVVLPSYMRKGLILNEISGVRLKRNAFIKTRYGVDARNAVVNFRDGSGLKSEFTAEGNQFAESVGGILYYGWRQDFVFKRNNFIKLQIPWGLLPILFQAEFLPENRVALTMDWNHLDMKVTEESIKQYDLKYATEPNLIGFSDAPIAPSLVQCEVRRGAIGLPAPGVEVEIRNKTGLEVSKVRTNAAASFVVSLPTGEYYARGEGAVQWTKIMTGATGITYCDLTLP